MKHLKTETGRRFAENDELSYKAERMYPEKSNTGKTAEGGRRFAKDDDSSYKAEKNDSENNNAAMNPEAGKRFAKDDDSSYKAEKNDSEKNSAAMNPEAGKRFAESNEASGSAEKTETEKNKTAKNPEPGRRFAKDDESSYKAGKEYTENNDGKKYVGKYAKIDDEADEDTEEEQPDNSIASKLLRQTRTPRRRKKEPVDDDILIIDSDQKEEDSEEERKSKKKKWTIIIPIVAVLLVLIGVIAVMAVQFMSVVYLDTVMNTQAIEVTENSVTLTWDEVQSADGYHVYQKSEDSDSYMQIASIDESTTYTATNLKQATVYNFFVKAFNGNNESNEFIPLDGVCTLPEKEEILNIYSDKAGSLKIEWKPNSNADGYIIEFHTAGKDYLPENQKVVEGSDITITTITELEYNAEVGVKVSAYCDCGSRVVGAASDEKVYKVWDGKTELPGQKSDSNNDNQTQTTATQPAQTYTESYDYSDQTSEWYDDQSDYDYDSYQQEGEWGVGVGSGEPFGQVEDE